MTATGFPTGQEVRTFLKGFGINTTGSLVLPGILSSGSAIITGIDTTSLEPLMYVSGPGIQPLSQIQSVDIVDPTNGQITLDIVTTSTGLNALTFIYFTVISNDWFMKTLTDEIQPIIERITRKKYDGIATVTEYYDGTGSSVLALRRRPIIALVNLSYTNVDSNLYYLSPNAMVVIQDEGILKAKANFNESTYTPIFWKGQRNLRVTYSYGYASCPTKIARAILFLMSEAALGQIADFTGGGSLTTQGYSRTFGKRGKYTDIRNSLARRAYALLREEMTGMAS